MPEMSCLWQHGDSEYQIHETTYFSSMNYVNGVSVLYDKFSHTMSHTELNHLKPLSHCSDLLYCRRNGLLAAAERCSHCGNGPATQATSTQR